MKERFKGFIAGIATTIIVSTMVVPVLAQTISQLQATTNTVNVSVNGEIVARVGEDYLLADGITSVPNSILHKGTTYLPLRKIGEVLGLDVDWDSATRTAKLKDGDAAPEKPSEVDLSDDTGYQEFKSVWNISIEKEGINTRGESYRMYRVDYTGSLSIDECKEKYLSDFRPESIYRKYVEYMLTSLKTKGIKTSLYFYHSTGVSLYWFGE